MLQNRIALSILAISEVPQHVTYVVLVIRGEGNGGVPEVSNQMVPWLFITAIKIKDWLIDCSTVALSLVGRKEQSLGGLDLGYTVHESVNAAREV